MISLAFLNESSRSQIFFPPRNSVADKRDTWNEDAFKCPPAAPYAESALSLHRMRENISWIHHLFSHSRKISRDWEDQGPNKDEGGPSWPISTLAGEPGGPESLILSLIVFIWKLVRAGSKGLMWRINSISWHTVGVYQKSADTNSIKDSTNSRRI